MQNCVVLDFSGYYMVFVFSRAEFEPGFYRLIVGFAPARRKIYFFGFGVKVFRYGFARVLQYKMPTPLGPLNLCAESDIISIFSFNTSISAWAPA